MQIDMPARQQGKTVERDNAIHNAALDAALEIIEATQVGRPNGFQRDVPKYTRPDAASAIRALKR